MPRRSKGPRLWLQPARRRADGTLERAVWVIRDGASKRSTGYGPRDAPKAQTALADHILAKSALSRISNRDPSQVMVADVIAIYAQDVAPKHSRPLETAARLERVLEHFGGMTLDRINKRACQAYTATRGKQAAARRELEDLRAAIRHHWEAGLCSSLTPIVLPDRGQSRLRWLTRGEAARLLWASRAVGHHVARFVLVALYTGTRAGAVCGAALRPTEGAGLDRPRAWGVLPARGRRARDEEAQAAGQAPAAPAGPSAALEATAVLKPVRRRIPRPAGAAGQQGVPLRSSARRARHRRDAAHPAAHLRDVAGAGRRPDMGGRGLPRNDG
jgi:tellurite resistance protein